MAPPNDKWIIERYDAAIGLQSAADIVDNISNALAFIDGGVVTIGIKEAVKLIIKRIIGYIWRDNPGGAILAALCAAEYYVRNARKGKWGGDYKAALAALRRKNRCSKCHLKGHNAKNCTAKMQQFVRRVERATKSETLGDAIGMISVD